MSQFEMGGYDGASQSSDQLIPKSQINNVLRNLNLREGLFSEEDIQQLEHGYSVSDTDEEKGGLLSGVGEGDLLSLKSGLSLVAGKVDYNMHNLQGHGLDAQPNALVAQIRSQEQQNLLYKEIANQKIKYFKKIAQLEKLMEQAKGEKAQLAVIIETQKQNFHFQQTQLEQKHQQQLREMRELHAKGEVPMFKEKLDAYKQEFTKHNLVVPEETYIELKSKPDHQQSFKEFVQLRVFECLQTYMQDYNSSQTEGKQLFHQFTLLKNKNEKAEIEISGLRQQLKEVKEDSERRIAALSRRNLDVESDMGQLDAQYRLLNEKSNKLAAQDEQLKKLEVEVNSLRNQKSDTELQLNRLKESKSEVEKRNESLRREIDILNQDKTFLNRENSNLQEKAKRLEDKVDRAEMSLLDAKKQAEKYMDRVLSANDDVKGKFDMQYTKEIEELKDRQAKELSLAKQNLTDLYERKVDYLTERKDEQERRIIKLEQDYRDKSKSYEELLFEFRQIQKNGDLELGSLKLEVRSKQDQVNRIQHLYEDNMILVKETKFENESLKQKLDVLKQEYYKLESAARSGTGDIKAELAVCKERLAHYEMIEKELDQAIMHVAGDGDVTGEGFEVGNALIQTITQAPTTSKRRIQQSLLLANRLQQKQKEFEKLEGEMRLMREKVENSEAEAKLHKRLLERTNQPQSYLLADVERSEKELDHAQRKIKQQDELLKKLKIDNESLRQSKKALSDDLQKLLARRQDIENLQTTLVGLIQNSTNRKIDVDDLKSKLAESVRQNRYQSETSNAVKQEKEAVTRKLNRSRSNGREASLEKTSKPQRYDGSDDSVIPAWYKTLKKNL